MSEIFRTRDCVVFYRSDSYAVSLNGPMVTSGWQGGQGVCWVNSPVDDFQMGLSDGKFGGFVLWGSDESSDQFVSFVGNQIEYGFAVLCTGSWLISTSTYERYTYASRQSGPLVPLTYTESDRLTFSLRGYWTNEDEWTLSGDPRAPNTNYSGVVVQRPSTLNNQYLGVHTTI
jgi:hypothetical protein